MMGLKTIDLIVVLTRTLIPCLFCHTVLDVEISRYPASSVPLARKKRRGETKEKSPLLLSSSSPANLSARAPSSTLFVFSFANASRVSLIFFFFSRKISDSSLNISDFYFRFATSICRFSSCLRGRIQINLLAFDLGPAHGMTGPIDLIGGLALIALPAAIVIVMPPAVTAGVRLREMTHQSPRLFIPSCHRSTSWWLPPVLGECFFGQGFP